MTLQLVRSTAAIYPFYFPAEIQEDSIVNVGSGFVYGNSDMPPVYRPEAFEIGDLQILTDLWSAIIKYRRLDFWKKLISSEEFFAACDKKAGEEAKKKLVELLMSHPSWSDVSKEEREKAKEQLANSLKEVKSNEEADEIWKDFYKDSFSEVFKEKQEDAFSNRTRIGRALNLFFKGIQLPLLHSFLSICLTLETLYTVEETEITYQFATRLANIIGRDKPLEQRKDIFERAREVYKQRSNVVHGRRSIETVESDILEDAFFFVRQSLQSILLDSTLLKLYSDPLTSDKTKDPKKAIEAIRNYFRDLDLR
jgi:hypothetical protein